MRTRILTLLLLCLAAGPAGADVYILNTTDERMSYEVTLPNGDTSQGEILEDTGYGPKQTIISTPEGRTTTFKVFSETGESAVEVTAPPHRNYIIGIAGGGLKMEPISWNRDNGQSHKRTMTLYNATGAAQTFDIIDEKEIRKGITLQPGEMQSFPAKNGFSGSSGFHHLRFANGQRIDNAASSGGCMVLHHDKRYAGEVRVSPFGWVTMPKGVEPFMP